MFKKITSTLSTLYIAFFTMTRGKHIGTDEFGNRYFTGKPRKGQKRERRWVMYNGTPEATKIPPEWHGWIHHQSDVVPQEENSLRQTWQKPHKPNLTGTPYAYVPSGHPLSDDKRPHATGDYEAWTPGK